ncbi:MAG: SDR family NAD(P)-dependent oxidoreductase, partial [Desulfamplus sp.]|nr:SDR family NAD(P)-dependent oxidoreductase [Desulfamplus sp.]
MTKYDIPEESYTPEEIDKCIAMLENMAEQGELLAHIPEQKRIALLSAAGRVSRPDRKYLKQRRKELNKIQRQPVIRHDRQARAATGIRSARETDVFEAPARITVIPLSQDASEKQRNPHDSAKQLNSPRNCYVCKTKYTTLHHFYDSMCPECADFNYQKRFQTASIEGHVALITGSRLKIGYQAALMMLRAGAKVIATTRFPVDAAIRYSREKDFDAWKDRLDIYGLDLRHIPSVEIFAGYIENHYHRLDILINNAAQTVRRPPGFYAHLMENENLTTEALRLSHPDAARLLEEHSICNDRLGSL